MGMSIIAVGGYSEVGRNMTALHVDDEILIFDMGLYLPSVIDIEEEIEHYSAHDLRHIKAIPDDTILDNDRKQVKAIIIGHAHLDHLGALPYLAGKYRAPIIGTPYTMNVARKIIKDKGRGVQNRLRVLNTGNRMKITQKLSVEFLNITHSTAQCAMIVVHTPYGAVAYCLDYKLDNSPLLGKKPDYERIKELKDVKCLILDSLDSKIDGKTPSEMVAKELLSDVLLHTDNKGKGIIVTTFSSHIARLKSIVECGQKLGRRVVFLGRSLNRYVQAAREAKIVNFDHVDIVAYRQKIAAKLKEVSKNSSKYLVVCTGNQGEKNSVLSRIANDELAYKFQKDDHVIFSCRTIPVERNIKDREKLEKNLKSKGVRIFTNIHASGHPHSQDNLELIRMVGAEHVIPAHGDYVVVKPGADIAVSLGYVLGKTVHILKNGDVLELTK